jgi:hypothetical protein
LFKITKTIHTCFFEPWNKFVWPNYPHQKTCMKRYSYFIFLKNFHLLWNCINYILFFVIH